MTDQNMPAHRPDSQRGWLDWEEALPDDLQRLEDSASAGDFDSQTWWHVRDRPATPTEKLLLTYLGYEPPADLVTRVIFLSPTIRRREWPQLETEETS